ncbi:MAG: hypothetical protein KDN22_27495 [Verrucomicrobiae bacterium]|nr:hypothetical protein [Verrucomicrobiae bacterium]
MNRNSHVLIATLLLGALGGCEKRGLSSSTSEVSEQTSIKSEAIGSKEDDYSEYYTGLALVAEGRGEDAVAALRKLKPAEFQKSLALLLRGWVEKDSRGAFPFISEITDESARRSLFDEAIGYMLRKGEPIDNLREAIKQASEGNERIALEVNIVARLETCIAAGNGQWTVSDLEEAFDGLPFGKFRNSAIKYVISALYKRDPSQALERITSDFTEPAEKIAATEGLYRIITSSDFGFEDVNFFLHQEEPRFRKAGMDGLVMLMDSQLGEDASLDGALQIMSDRIGLNEEAQKTLMDHWAYQRPEQTMQYLSTKDPAQFPEIVSKVARSIARANPEDAARWVSSIESPTGVEAVAGAWMGVDSISASSWVATLPQGELRDAGAIAIAERLLDTANHDEEAAEWISSIMSDEKRAKLEKRLAAPRSSTKIKLVE